MNFAYVDESGTLIEHEIMTVSLVLLDGRRAAEHISERILEQLYPHLADNPKALGKKKMHFADMTGDVQNVVATQLAQENIAGVINSHWHTGKEESHQTLFSRYTRMVQILLYKALGVTKGDLKVVIAEQGSPATYRVAFFADLDKTVELYRQRTGTYRKVTYELKSAQTHRGLQLADFYAGTVRKMWLESKSGVETRLCTPYRHVEHQISLEDYCEFE
jgi:hypothetical protein